MKITGIKVDHTDVPLIEPFRIALGVITHSRSAIVTIETDEGLVGYGMLLYVLYLFNMSFVLFINSKLLL